MRLTLKITIAILLGVALIFSTYSYFAIQREREQLKKNLSREARHLGESLRVMVVELWEQRGEDLAIEFLQRANRVHKEVLVRWVWLDGDPPERNKPQVSLPPDQMKELHDEETVAVLAGTPEGHDFLLTYLPMLTAEGRLGAIELSESMDELHDYVEESLRRSALVVAVIILSGPVLMALLGSIWINRPMKRLRAQAERIGTGDFETRVDVSGRGEMAELANTIERMRGQLAEARAAEQAATAAKFEALNKLRHTERLATIGRLSAGMAHELGTPLNVISGRAKLISSADLGPEDIQRSATIIGEQAERMTGIMRQLLSFARRSEPKKQSVELGGALQAILPLLEPSAKRQKVELRVDPAPEALRVSADPGQLQQVLLNLALNGIQAMPEGGVLELACQTAASPNPPEALAEGQGDWVCIQVRDQGVGIDMEHLEHIFDPFFTTKDVGQGTGLGLSIAYGIIEEHGGWIEVDSRLGEGSCFSVYLPTAENRGQA